MDQIQQVIGRKAQAARESFKAKRHVTGWVLPKQSTSFAPDGTWTNIDLDVTPIERRMWTPWSILGYWVSDIVSALSSHQQALLSRLL
jgi:nucleobase:cation symporter-1, NCS1 family